MTFTRSRFWFEDEENKKNVLRFMCAGSRIGELLCNIDYRIYKEPVSMCIADGELIVIKKKDTNKVVHQLLLKNDMVTDISCSDELCEYVIACAIKYGWLPLNNETYPLSCWMAVGSQYIDDATARARIILRKGKTYWQIRSKFFNEKVEFDTDLVAMLGSIIMVHAVSHRCKKSKKFTMTTDAKLSKLAGSDNPKRLMNLKPFKNLPVSKRLMTDINIDDKKLLDDLEEE